MTVYKYFIKIALKNKGIIISYVAIFFVISALASWSYDADKNSFVESKLRIGIVNQSNSDLSNELVKYLTSKNDLITMGEDENYIKEQIFLQIVDGVFIIPNDFDERVINRKPAVIVHKDNRQTSSYQIDNLINKFLQFAVSTYTGDEFDFNKVSKALDNKVTVDLIESENKKINLSSDIWFRSYFNFTSYIILAIYISVIGFVMTDFTDKKVEDRRRVSAIKLLKFNKEIYLGQITIALFLTLAFILGSLVLKGKYIAEVNFIKYIFNTLIFSLSALCLVFLINNITSNKFIISALSTVLSLGTSFISGVMVPQEIINEKVLAIAKFFPTYYFVKINETSVNSFADIRYEIFMQLLFALAFFTLGLYFAKINESTN